LRHLRLCIQLEQRPSRFLGMSLELCRRAIVPVLQAGLEEAVRTNGCVPCCALIDDALVAHLPDHGIWVELLIRVHLSGGIVH
jgi:hypothetical protein